MSDLSFVCLHFAGADAEKFLQGQVTADVAKLPAERYQATAISDLKGRVQYGIWLKRHTAEKIDIIVNADQADALQAHIKKFAAFSKATLHSPTPIYIAIVDGQATFADTDQAIDSQQWQTVAIKQGQAWITTATAGLFQPQELRLHQRGGVDYDKGCYLGQEIIARLWFRAQPKHWLHVVQGQGAAPADGTDIVKDVHVVNAVTTEDGWLALVVAKPAALDTQAELEVLDLPESLNGDVGRAK